MTGTRVYLWRSELAQRLYGAISDPAERMLFVRILTAHELTEAGLRVMSRQWAAGRRPGESLIAFLRNIEWLLPDAMARTIDRGKGRMPVLNRTATEMMRRESAGGRGFWDMLAAIFVGRRLERGGPACPRRPAPIT
jgi:hypothetical protein